MDKRETMHAALAAKLTRMGYPKDFGEALATQLRTEKTISRMINYLDSANPGSAEEIADEMLAICDDRDRWAQKKEAEFYNSKYNELLENGLEGEKRP